MGGTAPQCAVAVEPELREPEVASVDMEVQWLEVQWMATGGLVCTVPVGPRMSAREVKQHIWKEVGIPVDEQRLMGDEEELPADAAFFGMRTLRLLRSAPDPRVTDLGYFRPVATFPALPMGEFTQVRKLASGIHGDVYSYRWRRSDSEDCVAVKKLRDEALRPAAETNERALHMRPGSTTSAEDALTEIGVLSYLARQSDCSPYLLQLLGVFAEDGFTWLVTEFADGGELFEVAAAGRIADDQLQRYMRQLLLAVSYLHGQRIAHRDISLENILLKGGDVRLMDFGMSVSSHSASGVPLRFFRTVGKDAYRAPETYVPIEATVKVVSMRSKPGSVALLKAGSGCLCEVLLPEDMEPGQPCQAQVWGYAAQPADIFSCGVCLFMLAWQSTPWKMAVLADRGFAFLHGSGADGLNRLLKHWRLEPRPPAIAELAAAALVSEPQQRPTAADMLTGGWLAQPPAD